LSLIVSDFVAMRDQEIADKDRPMVRYSLKVDGKHYFVYLCYNRFQFGGKFSNARQFFFEGNELCRYRSFVSPFSPGQPSSVWFYTSLFSISDFPSALIDCWKNGKSFVGTFFISIFAEDCPQNILLQQRALEIRIPNYKKMLHENIATDMHLISKDKKSVKCQRAILAASSTVLQRKLELQTGNEEVDVMKHLSFKCINVVLSYIYYGDVSEVNTSVEFALQVLEAAIEFHLVGLVSHVQKSFEFKPNQDFTANDSVNFYLIVKSGFGKIVPLQGTEDNDGNSNFAIENPDDIQENKSDHENIEENESDRENIQNIGSDHENTEHNDDKNEAESSTQRVTGNGPITGPLNRKKLDNSGHKSEKRNCVEQASQDRLNEIKSMFSETSIENNFNGFPGIVTDELTQINLPFPTNDNNKDDLLRYRKLLETKADGVILW